MDSNIKIFEHLLYIENSCFNRVNMDSNIKIFERLLYIENSFEYEIC